jgi:hypothetical protein
MIMYVSWYIFNKNHLNVNLDTDSVNEKPLLDDFLHSFVTQVNNIAVFFYLYT